MMLVLTLIFSFVTCSQAATLKELRDTLGQKETLLSKVGAELKSLDQEIGHQNSKYLEDLEISKRIEKNIQTLKAEVQGLNQELTSKYQGTIKKIALLKMEKEFDDEESLVLASALKKKLKEDLESIALSKEQTAGLTTLLGEYEKQMDTYLNNQVSLHQMIVEMENKKKNMTWEYENAQADKTEIMDQLKLMKAEQIAVARVQKPQAKIALEMPLKNFTKYIPSNKGITFHYSNPGDVLAAQDGTVVYVGELANYGKVIMVDHGDDIRSVILGDLEFKVEKGQVVKKHDVLATALSGQNLNKSLYFEVRRKNIAQNTYQWLEDNSKTISI